MTPFVLKKYQTETLDRLRAYLDAARLRGAQPAVDGMDKPGVRAPRAYRPLSGLPAVPCICLRLPTGGGKTLLSAHAVAIAAATYLDREFPLTLFLVPTNTIRSQTMETLRTPGNPNYEALNDAFGGRFRVFDITDFAQITPADLQGSACIVVATMQTLRVTNTDGRRVYAHNENLEPHFAAVPANAPGMERIEAGEGGAEGGIKFSFRNLLAWHRPLVIVDEAHNNTSSLSHDVLARIGAACVVEFTATPATDSNILHRVSATELKAEQMLKLPIRLTPHKTWEDAVRDSILERQRLADIAAGDADYIRPIVLFQAEEKGREVTKEVLLKHLEETHGIARDRIAVVTGDQKELNGIDLLARTCKIDFVVTVEALKEGWDCSFAYVFCSAATVRSQKDVEQLLGRVLRMPYAKRRQAADLNRAYAHVSSQSWPDAVKLLHDRLVEMGFEDAEADTAIEEGTPDLGLTGGGGSSFPDAVAPTVVELAEDLSGILLSEEERAAVSIVQTATGSRVSFTGRLEEATLARIAAAAASPDARAAVESAGRRHRVVWAQKAAPAQRGVAFRAPQLCFDLEGTPEPATGGAFLDAFGWDVLAFSTEITEPDFRLTATGVQWEIDLNEAGRLTERAVGEAAQSALDLVDTGWTEGQLCRWLEGRVRQRDITQPKLLEFVRRCLAHLTEQRRLPLTALVRWKFVLAKVLAEKIAAHRARAATSLYQDTLFGPAAAVETRFDFAFDFAPNGYAPHWTYTGGRFQFAKHYYPVIGELKTTGEEYECAKALDINGKVKHWVRNLERRGFALPLAHGNFYPDFVAELTDGRVLVVEHKGEVYATNDDSKEKANIGALWEEKSGGKALFLMTVQERNGPSLSDQIAAKIG